MTNMSKLARPTVLVHLNLTIEAPEDATDEVLVETALARVRDHAPLLVKEADAEVVESHLR